MKIKAQSASLLINSLIRSFSVDIMNDLAGNLIEGYTLHERTGKIDLSHLVKEDAALQIVKDMKEYNLFPHFISLLVDVHFNWLMGRRYPVHNIKGIINEIQSYGFIYNRENKLFIEDPGIRITKNWSILHEDVEYIFTFMRLDIVGNTKIVRNNPRDVVESTYKDLNKIVKNAVIKRNGRIWSWEGDGGLASFYFSNKNNDATLSAMEVIHKVFMYNQLYNRLDKPLEIRIAIHTGPNLFTQSEDKLKKCDTIKKIIQIEEKHTDPNTITISDTSWISFDSTLSNQMSKINISKSKQYYKYELKWDNL